MGPDIVDFETSSDQQNLDRYAKDLRAKGYQVTVKLGYGNPKKCIPKIVKEFDAELLVMGSHGHQLMKDLILGTTIDSVRHSVKIPVLIV
jgi:manganese transport protein